MQMYADIPWVLACGGSKGELAVWDTEEDKAVYEHFKGKVTKEAQKLKKVADKGFGKEDAEMAEGDSSGFEDVDSDEEEETQEVPEKKSKKSKKSSK